MPDFHQPSEFKEQRLHDVLFVVVIVGDDF